MAHILGGSTGFAQDAKLIEYQIPNTSSEPQIDGVFSAGANFLVGFAIHTFCPFSVDL